VLQVSLKRPLYSLKPQGWKRVAGPFVCHKGPEYGLLARSPIGWRLLVLRRGNWLGKGDEVAARVLDAEFFHAVEGGANRHHDFHVLHGS
jgi:hypothetical protein